MSKGSSSRITGHHLCADGSQEPVLTAGAVSPVRKDFPAIIRHWREHVGYSLSEAAKLIGISKAHLWELEQARAINPTILTLAGIARAYGASLPYLAFLAAAQIDRQSAEVKAVLDKALAAAGPPSSKPPMEPRL